MTTKIKNCTFYGVKWDESAIKTVQTVADALFNLTELFKNQGIEIECLLNIDNGKAIENANKETS